MIETNENALAEMNRKRIRKVLDCNEKNEVIGVVSKTDILNFEMERQEMAKALKNPGQDNKELKP